jgi:crossover junction endodeoxyribonuclease RusA
MTPITIIIAGVPKPQPRARAYKRGDHAAMYDPKTANGWKNAIALAAMPHRPASPLTGPLRVDIDFFMPRPKRLMRKRDPDGAIWCYDKGRNDRDNLDKAVLDTLTDIGMWEDDGQVCCGEICKYFHAKDGRPGAAVVVQRVEEK